MQTLDQIELLDVNFSLTLNHIVTASKILIILFFLTCVLLIKGSFNNPLGVLYGRSRLLYQIRKFIVRSKMTIEWTLFTKMREYSYDLRLVIVTECGTKYEWYMIKDGYNWLDNRFSIKTKYSRTVLSTHYFSLFSKFMGPFLAKQAKEFIEERNQVMVSCVVEQVAFYSLGKFSEVNNRAKPIKVIHTDELI